MAGYTVIFLVACSSLSQEKWAWNLVSLRIMYCVGHFLSSVSAFSQLPLSLSSGYILLRRASRIVKSQNFPFYKRLEVLIYFHLQQMDFKSIVQMKIMTLGCSPWVAGTGLGRGLWMGYCWMHESREERGPGEFDGTNMQSRVNIAVPGQSWLCHMLAVWLCLDFSAFVGIISLDKWILMLLVWKWYEHEQRLLKWVSMGVK